MKKLVLKVNGLRVSNGDVLFPSPISFCLYEGELMSICGYRYSGKSLLAEAFAKYVGEQNRQPRAKKINISVIGNAPTLIDSMSIADNLIALRPHHDLLFHRKSLEIRAQYLLNEAGLNINCRSTAARLSCTQKHLVEIIKALDCGADIVVIDDVTENYSDDDCYALYRLMKMYGTVSFIVLSSKNNYIVAHSEKVIVLDDLHATGILFKDDYSKDRLEALMMKGCAPIRGAEQGRRISEEVAMSFYPFPADRSMPQVEVKKGEILGIYDMYGNIWSGVRDSVLHCANSKLIIGNIRCASYPQAVRNGLGFMSSVLDENLFASFSLEENLTLIALRRTGPGIKINPEVCRYLCSLHRELFENWDEDDIKQYILLVLKRWLVANVKVLVVENISHGAYGATLDKAYNMIKEAAQKGVSFVMISDNAEECKRLCDRILVLQKGGKYEWD